jgi:hypothetical protein
MLPHLRLKFMKNIFQSALLLSILNYSFCSIGPVNHIILSRFEWRQAGKNTRKDKKLQ